MPDYLNNQQSGQYRCGVGLQVQLLETQEASSLSGTGHNLAERRKLSLSSRTVAGQSVTYTGQDQADDEAELTHTERTAEPDGKAEPLVKCEVS